MEHLKIEDVMTNLVVRLYPNDTIQHAMSRLAANDISGAPVVENGRVVGVISEVDLVKSEMWAHVSRVMSTHLVLASPEMTVTDAAVLLERHRIKRLPVTDEDGYLIGIISRGDVVRAIAGSNDYKLQPVGATRT